MKANSFRAQAEWCRRAHGALVNPDDPSDTLVGATVAGWLEPQWTSERPTAGKWWVAIHPDQRDAIRGAIWEVNVASDGFVYCGDSWGAHIADSSLMGALWLPRSIPQDPFAGGGKK